MLQSKIAGIIDPKKQVVSTTAATTSAVLTTGVTTIKAGSDPNIREVRYTVYVENLE